MKKECKKAVSGPLGSTVGFCELNKGHKDSCRINGVSEQDMVDLLVGNDPASEAQQDSP